MSRALDRAKQACETIAAKFLVPSFIAEATSDASGAESICQGMQSSSQQERRGVTFLNEGAIGRITGLKLAIDLNAVPPMGIADVGVMDKAVEKSGVLCFGALGVVG